ncbi:hypothetical protein Brsp07_05393 [Brucella sp. NBRC 14130]|uniref:hypothetical protein n=1 Tax=Brucella sp. NBRC 14130 TaxID=3075483 RepID=UPI00309776CF|nr:hypothetical protein [Agrobacterium sp. S2]
MDSENYIALTLADVMEDGAHYLAHENADTATYYVREGNTMKQVVYHKTVNSVMEANAEEAKHFSRSGSLSNNTKVASMPTSVYLDLHAKGIAQDPTEFKKFLNHSDNAGFRTNNLRL